MGLIENWDRTRLIVQSCGAPLVADAMAAGQVVVRSHFIETRNGALELERILRGAVERVGITIGGSEQLDAILVQRVDQGLESRCLRFPVCIQHRDADENDGVIAMREGQVVGYAARLAAQPFEREDRHALDRKSTRLNSSPSCPPRMPYSA